ncbi:S-adenosylmethionine:tRNA ribosyltransferase-isomerase [Elysia marginata]|uniref:S-adenosylmethionine:tRNA ribosyltransferase-isomerase n=1 Tax=Elysia marginata TaxID=1093978 RepID=A0AAV4G5W8_9GAST|nr:S-adenosylmethionine:tRNA ribosyltransferase-isomerase [Elysia marginata]
MVVISRTYNHINFISNMTVVLPVDIRHAIAEYPTRERDECRLIVADRKTGTIEHRIFKDILEYFDEKDVLVLNNSKVFPARVFGEKEKTGAKIEIFLLRELDKEQRLWDAIVEPARKIRIGNKLYFGDEEPIVAEVIDNTTSRGRTIRFLPDDDDNEEFEKKLRRLGQTPLPKYIKREPIKDDEENYQTIYAKHEGAVAAPTAGLHFSKHLLKRLEIKGTHLPEITLHVGIGTFDPVGVEDISKHRMHNEQLTITENVAQLVNEAKDNRKKVCAVGTTVMRGLESSVSAKNKLLPFDGWTNKFIYPPHNFSIANCMITNFHVPKSTLLMMVSAFAGVKFTKKIYKEALNENYRFYSYGDAMLIL